MRLSKARPAAKRILIYFVVEYNRTDPIGAFSFRTNYNHLNWFIGIV